MILDVDDLAGRTEGLQVLIEDRTFSEGDLVGSTARACASVRIAPAMDVPLDLHRALTARRRQARRKRELIVEIVSPPAVVSGAIAGFAPSLNKVVVHVGSGWPAQLNIDVVGVPFAVAG